MSSVSSASSTTSGTLGDAPPVSFPGVASGIDYNSIIEKYTAETLQQEAPLQSQVSNLNNENTAVLKIKSLLGSVQDSLTALSNPTLFGAYKATPSNTADGSPAATLAQITGTNAVAGTYTINAQTAATATTVVNNPSANGALNTTADLDDAGTAVTATNGTGANGTVTINGVSVNYNVDTQSLTTILNDIKNQTGVDYTINANGTVTLGGGGGAAITSLGSGGDSGNLLQVLKLDTAQLAATGINSTSPISAAGFATTPQSGTVVVNGVSVAFTTSQSLTTILANIQSQTAGTVALQSAGLATTPVSGSIVINGTTVNYTTGQSLNTILANITSATGLSATLSGGKVTIGSAGTPLTSIADGSSGNLVEALNLTGPITGGATTSTTTLAPSIGVSSSIDNGNNTVTLSGLSSLADGGSGNLLEVLNLNGPISGGSTTSTAPLTGNATQVTSSSSINGINQDDPLNSANNAGFATAVTAGTFTINGVQFSVNPTLNSLSDIINQINSSSAGVVAQYNTSTSQITLTSSSPGPESILLGASGDTSNFLTATGLQNGTTTIGTQASLTYTANNTTKTVYSSSNVFANVVPGFNLTVTNSSPASFSNGQSTYYSVSVAADPSQAETAINAFIKAYNAAIDEFNTDLAAPTVTAGNTTSDGLSSSTSSGGGILFGNFEVEELKNQLVSLVSGFIPSGSNAYNSLSTVGILLNTSTQSVGEQSDSSDSDTSSSSAASSTDSALSVSGGTDGTLAPLDTTTFEAAYAANTAAVQALFTLVPPAGVTNAQNFNSGYGDAASAGFSYQIGSLISNANGLTTFLQNSAVTPADLSNVTLTTVLDANNQQIDSIDQQISQITSEANNQANQLRAQFTASESQIAELQALQQQIAAIGH